MTSPGPQAAAAFYGISIRGVEVGAWKLSRHPALRPVSQSAGSDIPLSRVRNKDACTPITGRDEKIHFEIENDSIKLCTASSSSSTRPRPAILSYINFGWRHSCTKNMAAQIYGAQAPVRVPCTIRRWGMN